MVVPSARLQAMRPEDLDERPPQVARSDFHTVIEVLNPTTARLTLSSRQDGLLAVSGQGSILVGFAHDNEGQPVLRLYRAEIVNRSR